MIPIHKITAIIALSVMSLSLYGQKRDTIPAIKPGIQWDTAVVIKPVKASEHLLGVKYDFSFTGVTMTPEMGVKAAGGVRTHEEMLEMVKNGATRIGTSSGAKLMK